MSSKVSVSVLAILALAFVVPAWADDTLAANKALVERVIEEVLNEGQLALADELVAEGEGRFGPEWFKTTYRMRRSAFPDLRYRIEETLAEGDRVVVRFTSVGRPTGPSVPVVSQDPVEVAGVAIFEVKDGKIVGGWELTDMLKLARETGYELRAPESTAEEAAADY